MGVIGTPSHAEEGMALARFILGGALVFGLASPGLAVNISAKSDGVQVTSDASATSAVVATLKKGEVVEGVERKGLFWMVKTNEGAQGYVSILKVDRSAGGEGGIAEAIRAASADGRSNGDEVENTRTRSAVMGVRGLDESEETQYAGNTKPNLRLVYQMEDRRVAKTALRKLEGQVLKELEMSATKGADRN